MTTQHHRTDTVAGLAPAGALPLQAASKSRLDPLLSLLGIDLKRRVKHSLCVY